MPDRLFRKGFVDSEAVASLSDWTHRLYTNLLIESDNAGRFDGRLDYLRSHLFPLGTSRRSEDFKTAVAEIEAAGLVIRYAWKGKPFLQLTKVSCYGSSNHSHYPWTDGSHAIKYVLLQTKNGDKKFVLTSLPPDEGVPTPSGPPPDPVVQGSDTDTDTGSGTDTTTGTAAGAAADVVVELQAGGDSLDAEVSSFVASHRFLTSDRKTMGNCRMLVEAVGWDDARRLIDEGVGRGSSWPVSWALGKARNTEIAKGAAANSGVLPPRRNLQSRKYAS